jgi:hypothetical protein
MTWLRMFSAGAAVVSMTVVLISASAQAPRDSRPSPVAHVSAMSDLAPSNASEREAARVFDVSGPKIRPGVMPPPPVFPEGIPSPPDVVYVPSRTELLRHDVCGSRVVVLAEVKRSEVILNASGSALVTVYYLEVDRWLYSAVGSPALVVGREGGRVFVAGVEDFTRPRESWFEDVQVGPTYLMHLFAFGVDPSIHQFRRQVSVSMDNRLSVGTVSGPTAQLLEEIEAVGRSCVTSR